MGLHKAALSFFPRRVPLEAKSSCGSPAMSEVPCLGWYMPCTPSPGKSKNQLLLIVEFTAREGSDLEEIPYHLDTPSVEFHDHACTGVRVCDHTAPVYL